MRRDDQRSRRGHGEGLLVLLPFFLVFLILPKELLMRVGVSAPTAERVSWAIFFAAIVGTIVLVMASGRRKEKKRRATRRRALAALASLVLLVSCLVGLAVTRAIDRLRGRRRAPDPEERGAPPPPEGDEAGRIAAWRTEAARWGRYVGQLVWRSLAGAVRHSAIGLAVSAACVGAILATGAIRFDADWGPHARAILLGYGVFLALTASLVHGGVSGLGRGFAELVERSGEVERIWGGLKPVLLGSVRAVRERLPAGAAIRLPDWSDAIRSRLEWVDRASRSDTKGRGFGARLEGWFARRVEGFFTREILAFAGAASSSADGEVEPAEVERLGVAAVRRFLVDQIASQVQKFGLATGVVTALLFAIPFFVLRHLAG